MDSHDIDPRQTDELLAAFAEALPECMPLLESLELLAEHISQRVACLPHRTTRRFQNVATLVRRIREECDDMRQDEELQQAIAEALAAKAAEEAAV